MHQDQKRTIPVVAEAAAASSEETAAAIDEAAEKNGNPEVAECLEHATLAAQSTVARTGWLREIVSRLTGRS